MKRASLLISVLLSFVVILSGCGGFTDGDATLNGENPDTPYYETVNDVPEFDGETPFVPIKGNVPDFSEGDLVTDSYEKYSELDELGRCSVVMACVGVDIMPTEDRGSIGQVKPSGWQTVKYDIVDGKYLYNRCHLIGFQLTGENANTKNLITGTRYLNIEGMLPFENMIADYVKETENHVIYRVTPIFDGSNLVARGVQMEAKSVEDNGEGILFNVYAYNSQPGISINYFNGASVLGEGVVFDNSNASEVKYILNTNSKKFHTAACKSAEGIGEKNKKVSYDTREALINQGYTPCKSCNP